MTLDEIYRVIHDPFATRAVVLEWNVTSYITFPDQPSRHYSLLGENARQTHTGCICYSTQEERLISNAETELWVTMCGREIIKDKENLKRAWHELRERNNL